MNGVPNEARGRQRSVHAPREGICEVCGIGFKWRGNGSRRRFCGSACRQGFHAEARRVGSPLLTRRLALARARRVRAVTRSVRFTSEALEKVGVSLEAPVRISLTCTACGNRWQPHLLPSGRLPHGYWRCPGKCNEPTQEKEAIS